MSGQLASVRQLMTKEQAGTLTAQLEKQDIVLNGIGLSLSDLVAEVAELGKQANAEGGAVSVTDLTQAVSELERVIQQVVAVLRFVRKRPIDWRLAVGLVLLGICLGSMGTFWWGHQYPQVIVQQVPVQRGK